MSAGVRKYEDDDDDDDWGTSGFPTPKRQPSHYHPLQLRRFRTPILVATLVIALFFWTRPSRHHPGEATDWSRFAYVQYVTDVHTMCNAFMVFEALHRLGSKAQRVLLYPEEWNAENDDPNDRNGQLLIRAMENFDVRLKPIQLLGLDGPAKPGTPESPSTWETSISKFRIFEQEEYDRVLYFDNDVIVQQHMDELFLLPKTPMAMPRRYWTEEDSRHWPLSGILMLAEPDASETKNLWDRLQSWRLVPERADCRTYDDDLLDDRFGSSALILPHRPYVLQTSEFRRKSHEDYLGTFHAPGGAIGWDPYGVAKEAKLIHFNDWPLPKPWIMWPIEGLAEIQPHCEGSQSNSCGDREVWKSLYDEFRLQRKEQCKILSVPAPQHWKDYKKNVGAV